MTRGRLGLGALIVLLLLTGGTFWSADGSGTTGMVALLALLKATVIGLVFLELRRSWPGWAVIAIGVVSAICGGAAALVGF